MSEKKTPTLVHPPSVPQSECMEVDTNEVIAEMNKIIQFTAKETNSFPAEDHDRIRTIHLLAVGTLYAKWMEQQTEKTQAFVTRAVTEIAQILVPKETQ